MWLLYTSGYLLGVRLSTSPYICSLFWKLWEFHLSCKTWISNRRNLKWKYFSNASFNMIFHNSFYRKLLLRFSDHFSNVNIASNGIRTHNHLVRKRTLNHLAKLAGWLCVRLQTKWCGFESRYCNLSFRYRGCFEQVVAWHSGNYRV